MLFSLLSVFKEFFCFPGLSLLNLTWVAFTASQNKDKAETGPNNKELWNTIIKKRIIEHIYANLHDFVENRPSAISFFDEITC